MFIRSSWVVLALCAGALEARADWQPVETPPVPPETEAAERLRAPELDRAPTPNPPPAPAQEPEPAPPARGQQSEPAPPARAQGTEPAARGREPQLAPATKPQAADGSATAPDAPSDTSVTSSPSTPHAGDPLDAFPPAPPPVPPDEPAAARSALTSFAPAPAPAEPTAPNTDASAATAKEIPPARHSPGAAEEPAESDAPASESSDLWSAAALLGVGVTFDDTVAGVNPLGFGFGVRGDYRILPEWALGARVLYFVGGSVELPGSEVSMQSWLIAGEGAYVLRLDPITIQPGMALGLHVRETDSRDSVLGATGAPVSVNPPDSTRAGLYIAPGVNVSLPLAAVSQDLEPFSIGADVRLDLVFGKRVSSNLQLLLQAGILF